MHGTIVGGKLHRALGFLGARDLAQHAAGQLTNKHIAIADEGSALSVGTEHGVAAIGIRHHGRIDQDILAIRRVDAVQVAHARPAALERVVNRRAIDAPVGRLDGRPDPVRIGHGLVEGYGLDGCRRQ